MSEFKGTRGPWYSAAKHDECEVRYVCDCENYNGSNDVCTLFMGSGLEQEANANLIAAAPELLEALQESMRIWENHKLDVSEASILLDCRAAIAKALGQQ